MKRAVCIGVAVAATDNRGSRTRWAEGEPMLRAGAQDARHLLRRLPQLGVRAGGVAFDTLPLDAVRDHADVWEKAVRKLRGRLMPPPGSRQPEQREIDAFVTWMEASSIAPPAGPRRAGHVPIQRLTRTEFARPSTICSASSSTPRQLLPAEIEVDGFDNIAAALSVSPAFLDQYVAAARLAAQLAVGESVPKVASAHYPQPERRSAGPRRRTAARHARRHEVPAQLSRGRRVPLHDSRSRRRPLHARRRDASHADHPRRRPRGVPRSRWAVPKT